MRTPKSGKWNIDKSCTPASTDICDGKDKGNMSRRTRIDRRGIRKESFSNGNTHLIGFPGGRTKYISHNSRLLFLTVFDSFLLQSSAGRSPPHLLFFLLYFSGWDEFICIGHRLFIFFIRRWRKYYANKLSCPAFHSLLSFCFYLIRWPLVRSPCVFGHVGFWWQIWGIETNIMSSLVSVFIAIISSTLARPRQFFWK